MENLITFEYKAISNDTNENSQICPICLENFVIKDKILLLNCMHKFHYNCIKPWFIVSNLFFKKNYTVKIYLFLLNLIEK